MDSLEEDLAPFFFEVLRHIFAGSWKISIFQNWLPQQQNKFFFKYPVHFRLRQKFRFWGRVKRHQ